MAKFEYPEAGQDAPAGVRQSIRQFHRLPIATKQELPLLYFLLGDGTPPYKMSRGDADYQSVSKGRQRCDNCISSYEHVKSGRWICDQISGPIAPQAWCRLWASDR